MSRRATANRAAEVTPRVGTRPTGSCRLGPPTRPGGLMAPCITVTVGMLYAWLLAGCATSARQPELKARIGPPVHYCSTSGEQFVARYGSLADGSLHFVKVQMPGGRDYTLPQVVSASGARYTDERELVWWTHQGTVRVDVRNAEGNWETRYPELQEIPEKN